MKEISKSITVDVPIEIVAGNLMEAVKSTRTDEILSDLRRQPPIPPKIVKLDWPRRIVYEYTDHRTEVELVQRGDNTTATFRITWRGFGKKSRAIFGLMGFIGFVEVLEKGYKAGKGENQGNSEEVKVKGV